MKQNSNIRELKNAHHQGLLILKACESKEPMATLRLFQRGVLERQGEPDAMTDFIDLTEDIKMN